VLTDEHRRLLADTRDLARDALAPVVARGEPGRVNRELVGALAAHGVLGRLYPAELGGAAHAPPTATELCVLR
jgi:acyl-CoA dehydrogenase